MNVKENKKEERNRHKCWRDFRKERKKIIGTAGTARGYKDRPSAKLQEDALIKKMNVNRKRRLKGVKGKWVSTEPWNFRQERKRIITTGTMRQQKTV